MKTKFYEILIEIDGQYVEFDGYRYTEKEAKAEIRRLRKESDYKFKLEYVGSYQTATLTVNQHV